MDNARNIDSYTATYVLRYYSTRDKYILSFKARSLLSFLYYKNLTFESGKISLVHEL